MPKAKGADEPSTTPTGFPNTPPPGVGADIGSWVLNAVSKSESTVGRLEGTLTGLQAQLNRMEAKLDKVDAEVVGHGRWMHTLKAFSAFIAIIFGFVFVNAVWPWLKSKLGIPATSP